MMTDDDQGSPIQLKPLRHLHFFQTFDCESSGFPADSCYIELIPTF